MNHGAWRHNGIVFFCLLFLINPIVNFLDGGDMKVLVACEYSGQVRDAFNEMGHAAISCDLLPTDVAGPHYVGDIFNMLNEDWDLIIAHPPCTALTIAGNGTYGEGRPKHHERLAAAKWTQKLWDKCKERSERVALENPVGVLRAYTDLPKPHYVQPYWFGHTEQKKTGLYLHGLTPLIKSNDVYEEMMLLPRRERERLYYLSPSADRWKLRSETYSGIAKAMAEQWGDEVTDAERFANEATENYRELQYG